MPRVRRREHLGLRTPAANDDQKPRQWVSTRGIVARNRHRSRPLLLSRRCTSCASCTALRIFNAPEGSESFIWKHLIAIPGVIRRLTVNALVNSATLHASRVFRTKNVQGVFHPGDTVYACVGITSIDLLQGCTNSVSKRALIVSYASSSGRPPPAPCIAHPNHSPRERAPSGHGTHNWIERKGRRLEGMLATADGVKDTSLTSIYGL